MSAGRFAGVTLAAVAAILGSGLFILMGLAMLFTAFVPIPRPAAPPLLKIVTIVMGFVMLAVAAWGITTAVGLFRLRTWSRWSILIFSALLAFMGGSSALMMTVIQMPAAADVSPQIMTGIKVGVALFYGILALIGAFWLFYFNTARVRNQFGTGVAADGPGGRPLSITVIAWLALLGGLFCAGAALSRFPGMVFGLIFMGWAARVFYLIFAAIEIWIGLGLLRLNPLSRRVAIGMFGYTILNSALFVLLPGYADRVHMMLDLFPSSIPATPGYDPASSMGASIILGTVVSVVPILFLIARRQAFLSRANDPQASNA
jgi:hypothetical protein